jgi:hypothetical protein
LWLSEAKRSENDPFWTNCRIRPKEILMAKQNFAVACQK